MLWLKVQKDADFTVLTSQLLAVVQSYFFKSDIVSILFNLALHIQEKGLAY